MKHTPLACIFTVLVAACGDPLVDPQTVIGLRVLGAKLSADDDPTVAEVTPASSATLSWLVVAERERSYRAMTLFCKAQPSSHGVPRCGSRFSEQEGQGSTSTALAFSFELPEDYSVDQEWLSFLALCEDGDPRWNKNTQRFSCSGGDQPVTGFYTGVGRKPSNHNPSLQDDTLRFNDEVWPETTVAAPECDTEGVPRLQSDELSLVQLKLNGSDSEKLDDSSYAAASHEALTYTHVSTTAGLSRAFSAIDPEAESKTFELELAGDEAWADVERQRLGTFYLVVSDGRGGSDWLQRHYCLTK